MNFDSVRQTVVALKFRFLGTSDVARWSSLQNYDPQWEERSKLIAQLVPRGSCVVDFGAGRRMLERHLELGCRYHPHDIVSRGDDTVIADLNARPLPDLSYLSADLAVLAGVFEYIADPPSFSVWLARQFHCCIVSYNCATADSFLSRWQEVYRRSRAGWVNTYTEAALLDLFERSGYALAGRTRWVTPDGSEDIFCFRIEPSRDADRSRAVA